MEDIDIHDEIAAFMEVQSALSETKTDSWVVFADARFQQRFPSFEDAYVFAADSFPTGKFLIRNLQATEPFLPMMYVA